MRNCIKLLAFLTLTVLNDGVLGRPQDMQGAALLAVAQVKETFDNGAVASDKKEFEFMGAKMKNDMQVGFGDAVRSKRSYQDLETIMSPKSFEYDLKRAARSAPFENSYSGNTLKTEEHIVAKRAADSDSSSSSIESQELSISSEY